MTFHPRNRHQGHYDFPLLIQGCPELAPFVAPAQHGKPSIDFSDPQAVRLLNKALLSHYYQIQNWEIPIGYLCPPIPGRSDYVHAVADLLSLSNHNHIPRGETVRGLDIGVGSSCIYPIIGRGEYGWSFVGTDVDMSAIRSAEKIVSMNPSLISNIELRTQPQMTHFFKNAVHPQERFDFSICNPPFHSSEQEATTGSRRKWKNLGKKLFARKEKTSVPPLNFGGQKSELWYPGGEIAFIRKMIMESREYSKKIHWFTSLLSKETHLPAIESAINKTNATDYKVIPMSQGQKKSRVVAWTFLNPDEQKKWFTKSAV